MNLTPWRRHHEFPTEMSHFRDEMNSLFDRLLTNPLGFGAVPESRISAWTPAIDVTETDDEIVVRAEIPGVPARELDVTLSGRTLVIAGEKEEVSEHKDENCCRSERCYGRFRRSVELPEQANPDDIAAEAEDGVLTVRVGKQAGPKPRRIEVKPTSRRVPVPL